MNEHYICLETADYQLAAVLHQAPADTGVLLVVGGPQYRVGSHRQFVKVSRYLAAHGVPSLRLDTAGMGDSSGNKAEFYRQSDDIAVAITAFFQHCPQLKQVVLWGLCDAASAILIALNKPDPRICAVMLLNPWVRQSQSHAKTLLKHYYLKRLLQKDFWQKLFGGAVSPLRSLQELLLTIKASKTANRHTSSTSDVTEQNYIHHMQSGCRAFDATMMLVTSGNDLTAKEFLTMCQQHKQWQSWLNTIEHQHIDAADHTFSRQVWRQQVEQLTLQLVLQQLTRATYG